MIFSLETYSDMDNRCSQNFPLQIQDVEQKEATALMKLITGERTGFVRLGPEGYFMPHKYKQEAADIYNMPLRDTDIFIVTFARSGTTWTQELIWLVANDLDYAKAAATPLALRFPFLEFSTLCHPENEKKLVDHNRHDEQKLNTLKFLINPGPEVLSGLPSPRFIKSHMPLSLLPPTLLDTARVVYVARDPRDVAVSFFFLHKHMNIMGFSGDFKAFWKLFIEDNIYWCPFFDHLKEAWKLRHHPNLLFLFYEDLVEDLASNVRRVSKLIGKQLSEQQVEQLCEHLRFDNFKNNKSVNDTIFKEHGFTNSSGEKFIRKGKSGGWRDYFDDEMTAQAQRWMEDNLRDTDLRFPSHEKH